MKINAATKVTGILGYPVAHSLSPVMHNAAFLALDINMAYHAFSVPPDQLEIALEGVRALGMVGVNVTVPHKERAATLVDWAAPEVLVTGALNTIVHRGGRLLGYNTDPYGFLQSLREERLWLRGKNAVVVGSGGAARGVVLVLQRLGLKRVLIFNRTGERALKLIEDLAGRSQTVLKAFPLSELQSAPLLSDAAVVINATSVGLRGERFFPLNVQATPPGCVFWDLVYSQKTSFLDGAVRAGRPAHNGLTMLLYQGARSFAMWTRRKPPLGVMRDSLKKALLK